MRVIFLQDVVRVGKRHDIKEVNDGYAMNFLFPRKLAEPATPKAIVELEKRMKNIAIEREVQMGLLMKNLEEIKGKVIVEEMKLQHHADIAEEFIVLEKPIKEVGEFEIPISIKDKKSSFKLIVEKI